LVGFCTGSIDPEESERLGRREGWTDPIGIHPDFRRMGLGRALLLEGFRRLKDHGMDTAVLTTGEWNTNARNLFESVGFVTQYREQRYTIVAYGLSI
jgi:ribosomal protein S18 acetylase RimI-like enzyme